MNEPLLRGVEIYPKSPTYIQTNRLKPNGKDNDKHRAELSEGPNVKNLLTLDTATLKCYTKKGYRFSVVIRYRIERDINPK